MNNQQPIAPGILRQLDYDAPSAAQSTEEYIARHRLRRQQWKQVEAKLASFDMLPTAGDLQIEQDQLVAIRAYERKLQRIQIACFWIAALLFCALAWIGIIAIILHLVGKL